MNRLVVRGGTKLQGELEVSNAKNCVLALLAGSILTEEQVILHNCPKIADVYSMIKILQDLGVKIAWQGDSLLIDSKLIDKYEISPDYAKEVRSSIFLMGSILGRLKRANAVFPGGCDIGLRPIDLHLKGLRALNISIQEYGGYLYCDGRHAKGGAVYLDFPSVGATENIILASVLTDGRTTINNVAKEPEIIALQDFLVAMGARVSGAGTSTIIVEGVKRLHGVEFTPIPDRIIAGTYLIAGAFTGGDLLIKNCRPHDMKALISKMDGNCGKITEYSNSIHIKALERPISIKAIETQPFPGFPTDLQTQILALQTVSSGVSMIVENIFETRFKHVAELTKLGADIIVRDRMALVRGVKTLQGAEVFAHDLRGGAGLVLAGLRAEGTTIINNVKHIDRGYCRLDSMLNSVGASIKREVD